MKNHRPVKTATLVISMVNAASTESERREAQARVDELRSSFLSVLRQTSTNLKESATILGFELRTFYRLVDRLRLWPDIEKIRQERRTDEAFSLGQQSTEGTQASV